MKACPKCNVVGKHHPTCPTLTSRPVENKDYSLKAYREFLKRKCVIAPDYGVPIEPGDVHPFLKPHQRAVVEWAVRGGRRAIFASFGLGKSIIQMETLRLTLKHAGGIGLIVAPLGVKQEFVRDGGKIGIDVRFVRTTAEALNDAAQYQLDLVANPDIRQRLYITNYESVRDGKLDPRKFTVTTLDEAAVLRSFGGTKTFREFMRLFDSVPYRFVATATPDPNEYIELLAYSAYLGILDVGEGKTRFFKRDSTKADKLTLHAHKTREWWFWVASWALFLNKPSDLGEGYSDVGYDLPPMKVIFHELPVEHKDVTPERDGQGRLYREAMHGAVDAAREKRDTLGSRVEKAAAIMAEQPDEHWVIWHDLEDERRAIEKTIPGVVTVYGAQRSSAASLAELEQSLIDFSEGRLKALAAKLQMFSTGQNWQYHCARAIFCGVGYKFADFVQGVHRIFRFLQPREIEIHIIYAASEKRILDSLLEKWERYKAQTAEMSRILQEYGLSKSAMANVLMRAVGCERAVTAGESYTLVNNDAVEDIHADSPTAMASNSAGLILTSIPFATQYEYTPNIMDFGHSESNEMFWEQMDYLIPQLLRVLKPGRLACIHVKDRIIPGGINGLGFQTVYPFHLDAIVNFTKHGFAYLGMKTIVTDVVRENNQTYRLGWTEQCKDGTKMGVGMPEYMLIFRKPPTDSSNAYADQPVRKSKKDYKKNRTIEHAPGVVELLPDAWEKQNPETGAWEPMDTPGDFFPYSRARWQVDAHGFERSNGNRHLTPEEFDGISHATIFQLFRKHSLSTVYDFEEHVALGEALEKKGILPVTFMLLQPASWHPDVWTDITRMRTLNGAQSAKGKEMHLCPMAFDLADRVIEQCSEVGDLVIDPFGGLGTVPLQAIKKRRRGWSSELNPAYWTDSAFYCKAAEEKMSTPTLLDLAEVETGPEVEMEAVGTLVVD